VVLSRGEVYSWKVCRTHNWVRKNCAPESHIQDPCSCASLTATYRYRVSSLGLHFADRDQVTSDWRTDPHVENTLFSEVLSGGEVYSWKVCRTRSWVRDCKFCTKNVVHLNASLIFFLQKKITWILTFFKRGSPGDDKDLTISRNMRVRY
jgi:hypothetical protein